MAKKKNKPKSAAPAAPASSSSGIQMFLLLAVVMGAVAYAYYISNNEQNTATATPKTAKSKILKPVPKEGKPAPKESKPAPAKKARQAMKSTPETVVHTTRTTFTQKKDADVAKEAEKPAAKKPAAKKKKKAFKDTRPQDDDPIEIPDVNDESAWAPVPGPEPDLTPPTFLLDEKPPRVFSVRELRDCDGSKEDSPILLAIMGQVFDVTKGRDYYAAGGGYGFFSGKDGSAAFVTGKFNDEGLTSDLKDLAVEDYRGLYDWAKFYRTDYTYVGVLEERFFDANGEPTEALYAAEAKLAEATALRAARADLKKLWPPCNSRWSQNDGSTVWCSNGSGGIERDWTGVPRQMRSVSRGKQQIKCVCAHPDRLDDPNLMEYEGCAPTANKCHPPSKK